MNILRNRPIGIIDSGVGGLSMLKNLIKYYEGENYIYLADNLYMPYGNKSKTCLKSRLNKLVEFLYNNYNVKLVIIACNTLSITTLTGLKNKLPVKIIGLDLNDLAKNALVLCTKLTSKGYTHLNAKPLSRLATIIEDNIFDTNKIERTIKNSLTKLEIQEKDIILGCTHYELVGNTFKKLFPDKNFILPCEQFVKSIQLDYKNPQIKGNILMLATQPTKSYIDKLWKVFKG